MKRLFFGLLFMWVAANFSSCNIDEEITVMAAPEIELDSATGIYIVKQGRQLCIAPTYRHADEAEFCWQLEGEVLSTERVLTFDRTEALGQYFLRLTVTSSAGSSSEELRIDVVELESPRVALAGADAGYEVLVGECLSLEATLRESSLHTTVVWHLGGEPVAEGLTYTFEAREVGCFEVALQAENEDGVDRLDFEIRVVEEFPFVWSFERSDYTLVLGRKLLLGPTTFSESMAVNYTYTLQEEVLQQGSDPHYLFTPTQSGLYEIGLTARVEQLSGVESLHHTFRVEVVADEGLYFREAHAESQAAWSRVFDYTPAPGQFINEPKSGFGEAHTTPEGALRYAEERMRKTNYVSLGGFGGYIVVGFDHSIENREGYDLKIRCNAFEGSSEPGVVYVMQDENGDGVPNDTWYELRGSETGLETTLRDYAVTYYRPTAERMAVQWVDSEGNQGQIDYLPSFHDQPYYFPLWVDADYTLRGTRLEARNYDALGNGAQWVQPAYDWGYVDNFSSVDFLAEDAMNLFELDHAIDALGEPVVLHHIDFVKVQSAVNSKSGWVGEISTEVTGFYDAHLMEN